MLPLLCIGGFATTSVAGGATLSYNQLAGADAASARFQVRCSCATPLSSRPLAVSLECTARSDHIREVCMDNSRVDVVIGMGPLGLTVTRLLLAKGRTVRAINRSGKARVPPDVEVLAGGTGEPPTAPEAGR